MMKVLDYRDYPNINADLMYRLWRYKNRNSIVYDHLLVSVFGFVSLFIETKEGILGLARPKFPDRIIEVQGQGHTP